MADLKDTYKTMMEQYGVDPKEGLEPNLFQKVLITEAELGEISPDVLGKSIDDLENEISGEADPKVVKTLKKKLENLKAVANRPKKEISMDLERKWSKNFDRVDDMINGLDDRARRQLLTNVFINENPKYHPERNSLVHIKIVASRGIDTGDDDLIKSALYHDIAKFDTATFNAAGWPTCLGHDKLGAESAKKSGMNDIVVYICENHMKVKGWVGDSEAGSLNPSTRFEIFSQAPGNTPDEKAVAFYKLCCFSKMDDMAYDFDAAKLKWDNPTYEKWDLECPLGEYYKKAELVEVIEEVEKPAFTSGEIIKFGAKGRQIGEINRAIVGKTREEAFEIIKQILGNPELQMESKKWIMTFENFKKSR
jgi:putative nucleotidyltransferase with HDIG domain